MKQNKTLEEQMGDTVSDHWLEIDIISMSDRWLNSIRKKLKDSAVIQPAINEIKRRKTLRKNKK